MDLFQYAETARRNARRTDPDTSHEAGAAANDFKGDDQEQIFQALQVSGKPMAAEEISDALGWGDHVRVNRRLPELAAPVYGDFGVTIRGALIERTEEKHVNRSGRKAYRYRVRQKQ